MDGTEDEILNKQQASGLIHYVGVVVLYISAMWFTDAHSMGDTHIYVTNILGQSKLDFWEFGHVLWRPFGWLLSEVCHPLTRTLVGADPKANVLMTLMAISWVTGLICVLLVHALARKFSNRGWVVTLVTIAFLFSNAFLNYAQTGSSYVPGLSFLLLSLYTLVKDGERSTPSLATSLISGLALALSIGMYFPYILSIPAILVSPLLLFRSSKSHFRLVLQTSLAFGLTATLVYLLVLIHLGIYNMEGLQAWIASSKHGVDGMKGIPRMVFGFARSLINMGNDGRLFKRYVVHDPLNPVSFGDLFTFGLWKLFLFYIFFLAILINLFFSRLGKRTLTLLLLNSVPLVVFALFLFESGTIDRYLPLYPMIFLAFAISLRGNKSRSWLNLIALVFVVVTAFSNVKAMSRGFLNRQQEAVVVRIRDLVPLLKPRSRVVTVNQQDEVYAFNQNFPFNPLNRSGRFDTDILVDPGTVQVLRWQQIFAAKTQSMWDEGGDVWITRRVLSLHPRLEWNWVEGDDPRVSWIDIYRFFSQIEIGQSVSGDDGFVLVSPSPQNKELLSRVTRKDQSKKH